MKKVTAFLLVSTCSITFVSNLFGMLPKRRIALPKQTRSFHTSNPAAYMDPLGAGAWFMSFINTWSIYENDNKLIALENRIKQLEETVKQNEKQYSLLALKSFEQSKKDTTKLKTNQE